MPLKLDRVFDRAASERERMGLSCAEVSTAEYKSAAPLKADEVALLSRARLDGSDARVFPMTKVSDGPTLAAIKRRLGRRMPYGFLLSENTRRACADRPEVVTLRFRADGDTYVWHQTRCVGWGEVAYGVAFVGLYRVVAEGLEPVFANRGRSEYLSLSRFFASDLDRNSRFEFVLDREHADSGAEVVAEVSGSGYSVLNRVASREEGSGCVHTDSAEPFLRRQ